MTFRIVRPKSMSISSLRRGPFYTVASVELGNTTTKCIIVSTNLQTGEMFEIAKEVRLTKTVRPPRDDETVFGSTLVGIDLTRESVAELVRDVLLAAVEKVHLNIDEDIHFVVRSTGVTAGFAHPEDVGEMVKALAEGCLAAGVPPRKMTASISPTNLPPGIRQYTWLKKVYFDGAVAGSLPPANTEIVANEMEGELVTAGLKGAAKSTSIDFRNPVMTLDFGTTLAGRITDNGSPYAKTVGSFAGLGGAIPDAIIRGTDLVDAKMGSVIEVKLPRRYRLLEIADHWIDVLDKIIRVAHVPDGVSRYGTVPVNTQAASESGVALIGVDAGTNGSGLEQLRRLGQEIYETEGLSMLISVIDHVQANIVQRLVAIAESEGLIYPETSLGLTGRAITSGAKPRIIANALHLDNGELWTASHDLLLAEDGLAMGAGVAARCMNSLGTPRNPMGGRRGEGCVMASRMRLQKRDHGSDDH
ncbi:MAG: methanogenesis marker 14 protein [Candidatus Thorarchaeota archaeon]